MPRTYGTARQPFGPQRTWLWSCALHRRGWRIPAKVLKGLNFTLFRAILPPEAEISADIRLPHKALGVVVHPNTTIGKNVRIWHNVTLASNAAIGGPDRIVIEDDVEIGAGAVLVNQRGRTLRIGANTSIGANTTVVRDVPPHSVIVGAAPRIVGRRSDVPVDSTNCRGVQP